MVSFIEFTKSIMHIFYILDELNPSNDCSEDENDETNEYDDISYIHSPNLFVNGFSGLFNFLNNINIFLFHLLFSSQSSPRKVDNFNNDNKPKNTIDYSVKYDNKFSLLEKIPLTEECILLLPNNIVMDYTPNGNVIMFFDNNKKSFQYYSDFNIPYSYLESVSKKYCIVNQNSIFRDLKIDIDVNNEFAIVKNKTSRPQSKSFATLKNYNNTGSNSSMKMGITTPNNNGKACELKIIQKDIVRYTHLGKLCNFSILKNIQPKYKNISYKDFGRVH